MMEIDPNKHEMWIRVRPEDSENFRLYFRPGHVVTIVGVVAKYESSGGHDDFEGDFIFPSDRFQLAGSSLQIAGLPVFVPGESSS